MIGRITIQKLGSEAELAAVVAHEMAHIEGHHASVSLFGPETGEEVAGQLPGATPRASPTSARSRCSSAAVFAAGDAARLDGGARQRRRRTSAARRSNRAGRDTRRRSARLRGSRGAAPSPRPDGRRPRYPARHPGRQGVGRREPRHRARSPARRHQPRRRRRLRGVATSAPESTRTRDRCAVGARASRPTSKMPSPRRPRSVASRSALPPSAVEEAGTDLARVDSRTWCVSMLSQPAPGMSVVIVERCLGQVIRWDVVRGARDRASRPTAIPPSTSGGSRARARRPSASLAAAEPARIEPRHRDARGEVRDARRGLPEPGRGTRASTIRIA